MPAAPPPYPADSPLRTTDGPLARTDVETGPDSDLALALRYGRMAASAAVMDHYRTAGYDKLTHSDVVGIGLEAGLLHLLEIGVLTLDGDHLRRLYMVPADRGAWPDRIDPAAPPTVTAAEGPAADPASTPLGPLIGRHADAQATATAPEVTS